MNKPILIIAALIISIATAIHSYYTDYGNAADGLLVKILKADEDEAIKVHYLLSKPIVETPWRLILKNHGERVDISEDDEAIKWTTAMVMAENKLRDAKTDAEQHLATKKIESLNKIEIYQKSRLRADQIVEEELDRISKIDVYFGILPAKNIDGEPKFSSEKSFWIGVILPLSLAITGLALAALAYRPASKSKSPNATTNSNLETCKRDSNPNEENQEHSNKLSRILKDHFGSDFPVEDGTATENSPLVVTELNEYVTIEHAIAKYLMHSADEEFKLDSQSLINRKGRYIDELRFSTKPSGSSEWTSKSSFFFDITAGYSNIGKH